MHESILRPPALSALKSLPVRCLGIVATECQSLQHNLSPDANTLLNICQALRKSRFSGLEIGRLAENELLHEYAEHFLERLTYDSLLMLALLTWHFDASFHDFPATPRPPRGLLEFFSRSTDDLDQLCKIIWDRYNLHSERIVAQEDFRGKFRRLLSILEYGFSLHLLASSY